MGYKKKQQETKDKIPHSSYSSRMQNLDLNKYEFNVEAERSLFGWWEGSNEEKEGWESGRDASKVQGCEYENAIMKPVILCGN
jgi:hypothetical protein